MVKTRKSKIVLLLMAVVMFFSVFCGLFAVREKSTKTATAEETVSITQVQFRTDGTNHFVFLRMGGQTDYAQANQWHDPSMITNTNLLDKVTVYFLDGAYTLREIWKGENVATVSTVNVWSYRLGTHRQNKVIIRFFIGFACTKIFDGNSFGIGAYLNRLV